MDSATRRRDARTWLAAALATVACLTLGATPCTAQSDSSSRSPAAFDHPRNRFVWPVVLGAMTVTALEDRRLNAFAMSHHTRTLDHVARVADPFGRAGVLVPALALSVVAPRLAVRRALSDAMLRVALGYAAADGVESVLKPLVGRHRPSDGGSQWRFHPLKNDEQWHSFPSAHTVHAFGLATGLAIESRTPWIAVPALGVATIVGLQRVYTGAHWGSDVIGSAALAVGVAAATDRMLQRRGLWWLLKPVSDDGTTRRPHVASRALGIAISPGTLGVRWAF